jgi:hypothetical protein
MAVSLLLDIVLGPDPRTHSGAGGTLGPRIKSEGNGLWNGFR